MRKKWKVVAHVRRRDALGVFYPQTFEVEAIDAGSAQEEWFIVHGNEWQLHHFESVVLLETPEEQEAARQKAIELGGELGITDTGK